jgi:hypothetical protein
MMDGLEAMQRLMARCNEVAMRRAARPLTPPRRSSRRVSQSQASENLSTLGSLFDRKQLEDLECIRGLKITALRPDVLDEASYVYLHAADLSDNIDMYFWDPQATTSLFVNIKRLPLLHVH